MLSRLLLLATIRLYFAFGIIPNLNAFLCKTYIGSSSKSVSNLKPIQSLLSSGDSTVASDDSLFRHELSLYQNKMESLRNVWEAITSFDDNSEDFLCRSFSADGFQNKAEFPLIKDIEVNESNTNIVCPQAILIYFPSKFYRTLSRQMRIRNHNRSREIS